MIAGLVMLQTLATLLVLPFMLQPGDLTLHNVTITNNRGTIGAAIYADACKAQLSSMKITNNSASLFGGVFVSLSSSFRIFNASVIANNSASSMAAVFFVETNAYWDASIIPYWSDDTLFVNNTSPFGCNEMMVSYPAKLAFFPINKPIVIPQPMHEILNQSSGSYIQPPMMVALFDWFDNLFDFDYGLAPPLASIETNALDTDHPPSGRTQVTMLSNALGQFRFDQVAITSKPGTSPYYSVAFENKMPYVMDGFPASVSNRQLVAVFTVQMRTCVKSEQTTDLLCEPCSPVRI
jgi:hypothetical protein